MAFHEKAGRSQEGSFVFRWTRFLRGQQQREPWIPSWLFFAFGFTRFFLRRRDQPESAAFMDRYMLGFVTLNKILGCFP